MSEKTPGTARAVLQIGLGFAALAAVFYVVSRDQILPKPAGGSAFVPAASSPDAPAAAESSETKAAAVARAVDPAAAERPSIDVVRVAPDGAAVVAGRAEPGSSVTVFADERPISEVEADPSGNFVAIFNARPSGEPRALTLGSKTAEGAKAVSDQVVLLLPEIPPTSAGTPELETTAAAPGTAEAVTKEAAAIPQVGATAILSPDKVEVTPLARPTGAAADRVSLASISYADAGEITLAGFGLAGSRLRAYVDDAFARDGTVDDRGRWTIALGEVATGIYRLRIDQLAADGRVSSRIETPFQRDFPEPRPAPGGAPTPVSVVVQPGNNLWTLARIHYGAGVLYTQIFSANTDLIGDPNLIYPGQIFRLPGKQAVE